MMVRRAHRRRASALLVLILLVLGVRELPRRAQGSRLPRLRARRHARWSRSPTRRATQLFDLLRRRPRAVPARRRRSRTPPTASACSRRSSSTAPTALEPPGRAERRPALPASTMLEFRRDGIARSPTTCRNALGDQAASRPSEQIAADDADLPHERRDLRAALHARVTRSSCRSRTCTARSQVPEERLPARTSTGSQPDRGGRPHRGASAAAADGLVVRPGRHAGPARQRRSAGTVSPAAQTLSATQAVEIPVSSGDPSFDVQVTNQGENTETDVQGHGHDRQAPASHRGRAARSTPSPPGEHPDGQRPARRQTPPTGQTVAITVQVMPVPGEKKIDNNTARPTPRSSRARPRLRSSSWPVNDLGSTQGIVALAARGRGRGRAPAGDRPGREAAPAAGRPAGGARRTRASATSSRTPQRLEKAFVAAARLGGGDRSPGSTSAWAAPSSGSTAASPTRALVRYDAYGEMSGHQSSSRGAARLPPHAASSSRRSTTATGARLRQAGARRAAPSSSSHRRSSEAVEHRAGRPRDA